MKLKFDLFKKSGKWGYSGIADIPDKCNIWDDDIFEIIAAHQTDVVPSAIINRHYHMIVNLIECETDPNKFFTIMYPIKKGIDEN